MSWARRTWDRFMRWLDDGERVLPPVDDRDERIAHLTRECEDLRQSNFRAVSRAAELEQQLESRENAQHMASQFVLDKVAESLGWSDHWEGVWPVTLDDVIVCITDLRVERDELRAEARKQRVRRRRTTTKKR